jgi:hypothetical protein
VTCTVFKKQVSGAGAPVGLFGGAAQALSVVQTFALPVRSKRGRTGFSPEAIAFAGAHITVIPSLLPGAQSQLVYAQPNGHGVYAVEIGSSGALISPTRRGSPDVLLTSFGQRGRGMPQPAAQVAVGARYFSLRRSLKVHSIWGLAADPSGNALIVTDRGADGSASLVAVKWPPPAQRTKAETDPGRRMIQLAADSMLAQSLGQTGAGAESLLHAELGSGDDSGAD